MGIIEAVKRGFGVATKLLKLVLVLFIFNAIWNLGSIPFITPQAAATTTVNIAALVFSLVFVLASIFMQGGTLGIVRDYLKTGTGKLGGLVSYGLKYYLRLLVLGLIVVLIIGIVAILAVLIIAGTAPLNQIVVTVIAATVAIAIGVIGVYFVLLLVMAPYILVCEEAGVIASIKKSIEFVRRTFLKVFLLLVVLILLSIGMGFTIGFLTGLLTIVIPMKVAQIIIGLVNSAFNGYLGIVMMAAFMAFYFAHTKKVEVAPQEAQTPFQAPPAPPKAF